MRVPCRLRPRPARRRVVAILYCLLWRRFLDDEFCCQKTERFVFTRQAKNFKCRLHQGERTTSPQGTVSLLWVFQQFCGCKKHRIRKRGLFIKGLVLQICKLGPFEMKGKLSFFFLFLIARLCFSIFSERNKVCPVASQRLNSLFLLFRPRTCAFCSNETNYDAEQCQQSNVIFKLRLCMRGHRNDLAFWNVEKWQISWENSRRESRSFYCEINQLRVSLPTCVYRIFVSFLLKSR